MSNKPLIEFRNIRIAKAEKLVKMGFNPYPSRCSRTHYAKAVTDNYETLDGEIVSVAGRLMSWRKHGALTFGHIQDQTGRIQLYIRRDILKAADSSHGNIGYADLKLIEVGDFVEASGKVTRTERGEISVQPDIIRLITKSIRPLPEKRSGLKDREAVLRRRYLDTTMQPHKKEAFENISRMLFAIRTFFNERGFLEFHTPVLQPLYGGGTAKPFTTHVNALGCDVYLAISHELYLKRLIAAGFDRVYTIGKYFRNEGIDRSHHPEFSMIETMTAYENYEYNMDLIEDLFRYIAQNVFGKTVFRVNGQEVDFGRPWKRISMVDAVLEVTGVDFSKCRSVDEANSHLSAMGINESLFSIGLSLVKAFEEKVEATLVSPTLVYGHPMDISPLAKPMVDNPEYAERFEIFIGGMECGDNWSEQNDPVRLLETWKSRQQSLMLDAEEIHPLDYDFIEVMEYGMPPTTGIGPGIERMAMLFTEQDNIDDVIFFPVMRPVLSPLNAEIYGIDERVYVERVAEEDILLTMDEFESLLREKTLSPSTPRITIRPYLRFWGKGAAQGQPKASGYLEIEGFIKDKRVRVVGFTIGPGEAVHDMKNTKRFRSLIESSIRDSIGEHFSDCDIRIHDVILLHDPRLQKR